MKRMAIIAGLLLATFLTNAWANADLPSTSPAKDAAQVERICRVKICNKLERFSLDPFSHLKDAWGEQCFEAHVSEKDAVKDKVLDQQSRWYQGKSWNPTKKSVTRVKEVYECK